MKAFFSDCFQLPLPEGHRFPVEKYRLLRARLEADPRGGGIELVKAPSVSDHQLKKVHTDAYLNQLLQGTLSETEQRRIGFPWSPALIRRCRHSVGGTLAAARNAWQEQIAVHLAGGTHHAFADHGQGFCVFNDVAVAIQALFDETRIQKAVVIDCDVHQGNGTASLFADNDSVFTFSMHGANNFPFRKCAGDLDIELPDGTTDEAYLAALDTAMKYQIPLEEADFAFYLAGADPFLGDRYGRLSLSKAGLAARDQLVIKTCHDLHLPLTIVMAGGYAKNVQDIVDIHAETVFLASQVA